MAVLRCTCGNMTLFNTFPKLLSKNYPASLWKLELHTASLLLKSSDEPVVRKKRDRFTVLKALASTVDIRQNKPDYRFFDDHILLPRTLRKQKEALMAMESGEKVANQIIKKYSHLFPFREPVPSWPDRISDLPKEVSVEGLKKLIKSGDDLSKAVEWYQLLLLNEDLSLDVHNDMLDFVSFYALMETGVVPDDVDLESDNKNEIQSLWRKDNMAEKLFAQMLSNGKADRRTYEVFILGLLKHRQTSRAFDLFNELLNKELRGSLFLYNTLLENVMKFSENEDEQWNLAQQIVNGMRLNKMKPNVVTFNELMKIASHKQVGAGTLCVQMLREMKKLGITPSLGIYKHIIFADEKEELMDANLLIAILGDLKSGKVELTLKHPDDLQLFDAAMDRARYKRRGDIAKQLLYFVKENKLEYMIPNIKNFYANYLTTVARRSTIDYLIQEYRQLVPTHFIPHGWVFEQIFYAFNYHKNPTYVPEIFKDMISLRIPVTPRGINSMFYAMASNIPEERARDFLFVVTEAEKWMDVYNIPSSVEIDSITIQVFCLNGKYAEALQRVEQCQKEIPTVEAMMSVLKLSVDKKDTEGSLKILALMAKNKMKFTDEISKLIKSVPSLRNKEKLIGSWF